MVKHSRGQTGSVHIVVVVIIIAVVLAILGFVFWKNVSKKMPSAASTTTSNSAAQKPSPDYLTVGDWGIKFKIVDELKSTDILTTKNQSNDATPQVSYSFTTKRIQDLGGACATRPFGNTEILTRTSNKPNATPDGVLLNSFAIDGYYYILGAPSATCTVVDSSGTLLQEARVDTKAKGVEDSDREALKSMLKTIQSINTNDKFLVLADWDIQFQIPAYLGEVTYYSHKMSADTGMDPTAYDFSTKAVEALGGDCASPGTDGYVTYLAEMARSKQKISTNYTRYLNDQPIAGYYYYLSGAQSLCANTGEDIQSHDLPSIMDMLMNPIAR